MSRYWTGYSGSADIDRNSVFRKTSKGKVSTQDFLKTRKVFLLFIFLHIYVPYEFLELIDILFCSILNRIAPDMSRYYRNSVFRQTSKRLVST